MADFSVKTKANLETIKQALNQLAQELPADQLIEALNAVRYAAHCISPLNQEPVDCVLWIKKEQIEANDYNPNQVAPPEMKLLEHSIREDGYTQPIVAWRRGESFEVVDGFHRSRVGQEVIDISERVHGYLPVTIINQAREGQQDRMASTIRHNRARGKHRVDAMSDIVQDLVRRNWDDKKIAKELGMDADEVLRLKQITGLAELFADREFSKAWEVK